MPDPAALISDATPCGRVESVGATDPVTCVLDRMGPLGDGDRVRLAGPDGRGPMAYIKRVGDHAVQFYDDPRLTKLANRAALMAGQEVIRLAKDDWAIVIGVNFYRKITPLNGPLNDAQEFVRWLNQVACVPDDQITTVKASVAAPGTDEDAIPTLESASRAFEALCEAALTKPDYRLGRRLYIFCAGHGIAPLQGYSDYREAALLMATAGWQNSYFPHIATRSHAEWFRAHGIFDEVILFVDSCRDIEQQVALNTIKLPPLTVERDEQRSFYVMPAKLGRKSYEYEAQVGATNVWRGQFSYALMEALDDPALHDGTGLLTGSVLRDRLNGLTLKNGQRGVVEYDPLLQELVFLRRRDFRQPVAVISFDPARAGQLVSLNSSNAPTLTELVPPNGILTVPVVEKRLYEVTLPDGTNALFKAVGGTSNVRVGL